VGFAGHRRADAAAGSLLLRLSLQDLLEETQGPQLQERIEERRGSEERPDPWEHPQGQGVKKSISYVPRTQCSFQENISN